MTHGCHSNSNFDDFHCEAFIARTMVPMQVTLMAAMMKYLWPSRSGLAAALTAPVIGYGSHAISVLPMPA